MENKLLQLINLLFSQESVVNLVSGHTIEEINQNDSAVPCLFGKFIAALSGNEYFSNGIYDANFEESTLNFVKKSGQRIRLEFEKAASDQQLSVIVKESLSRLKSDVQPKSFEEIADILWPVFFPEGLPLRDEGNRSAEINKLREKRTVEITESASEETKINNPVRQLLMTSNILTTVSLNADAARLSEQMQDKLKQVEKEEQKYWYDHPIPLGVSSEANEALYGLNGLNEMMAFEKEQGAVPRDARLTCVLSASTTHDGLHELIRPWITGEIKKRGQFEHLDVYIFTEEDTEKIVDEIFIPLMRHFNNDADVEALRQVFGVDGEYGRHYSFLKAISAFWHVFINPQIEATFKIDLDQVFPQEELLKTTGRTALQLLADPNWGACGVDHQGRAVNFGMIAGALVDYDDIEKGLFTPDVAFPRNEITKAEETVFFSRLPQAQSTQAEMMARYVDNDDNVIHRIHVTGGTNGILVEALFKYRPFTPTFMGRAEDQAYLFSVLFDQEAHLRYLHKPGLIMRHDKKAFAWEAMEAAQVGKWIGDYIRTLLFSYYAKILPRDLEIIKSETDPFTGCFISKLPITLVYLRWIFKSLDLYRAGETHKAEAFLNMGAGRLDELMDRLDQSPGYLHKIYFKEKSGWNLYYDLLILTKKQLNSNDPFLIELTRKAEKLIGECRVS